MRRAFINIVMATVLVMQCTSVVCAAENDAGKDFKTWIKDFYSTAESQGISKTTYQKAFSGVSTPDKSVLKKASYQPEFKTEVWDYLDARVNSLSVAKGKKVEEKYLETLDAVEKKFGVRKSILLAIWSMESNYGAILERTERLHFVPRALATLAYGDPKRERFGRTQLIASLKILQAGDIGIDQFRGSWAGAMGHTQFIPTSYLAYGVDMDGDGRRDIWNTIPDALATAANLLKENGWRTGKTWGYEVVIPQGGEQYNDKTKLLKEWQKLGFKRPGGKAYPWPDEKGVLKLLAGPEGPAFLMMKNFYVLKRYNNANAYALAVGVLADRLAGFGGPVQSWPRPKGSLSMEDKFAVQTLLQKHGYYTGNIDGYLGKGTRGAIRKFQAQAGLEQDGVPTQDVLKALRK